MVVAVFNQEKVLVGAFSVITNLRMELFEALIATVESQTKKVSQYILVCVRLDLKMKVNITWHLCFTLLKNK